MATARILSSTDDVSPAQHRPRWMIFVVAFGIATLPSSSAAAPKGAPTVADDVVQLRRDVEELSSALFEHRSTSRAELVALVNEREDLKRQVRLETVKKQTLSALSQERALAAQGLQTRLTDWADRAAACVASATEMVRQTAPVHREERLATLERISASLAGPRPDVSMTFERLWRFLEEDEALSRAVAIDQQVFDVDGKRRVLDIAHIGLSALYVRHDDGLLGTVRWTDAGIISIERATTPETKAAIQAIFDAVRRGQRETKLLLPLTVNGDSIGATP